MSNIPIIGQQPPPQASTQISVLTNSGMVAISIIAPMSVEVAAQVMANLGAAIEKEAPGSLIPTLEKWLAELKRLRDTGNEVLRELKLA